MPVLFMIAVAAIAAGVGGSAFAVIGSVVAGIVGVNEQEQRRRTVRERQRRESEKREREKREHEEREQQERQRERERQERERERERERQERERERERERQERERRKERERQERERERRYYEEQRKRRDQQREIRKKELVKCTGDVYGGQLSCEPDSTVCLVFASYGNKMIKGAVRKKRVIDGCLQLDKDIERIIKDVLEKDATKSFSFANLHQDRPYDQHAKKYYIKMLKQFLIEECKDKDAALIWYTGHGYQGTGNWCFRDGRIKFKEIFKLYMDHFRDKLLYIVTDCCYSGQWVLELAKKLDKLSVAPCGHHARHHGIRIKIFASCGPYETARDLTYMKHHVTNREIDGRTTFLVNKKIRFTDGTSQTTCYLDSTEVACFRPPTLPCNIHGISIRHDWNWDKQRHMKSVSGERNLV